MWLTGLRPLHYRNSSLSNYHLFPVPKQSLCGHKVKDIHMVETGMTWWLITQDMDFHQQGKENVPHNTTDASTVAGTMWKSSGIAIQLNLKCSY
jgi:hypothetical protein